MSRKAAARYVDLPSDIVLSARHVSKRFSRNIKRSMLYGMQDLARNMLGLGVKAGGAHGPDARDGRAPNANARGPVDSELPLLRPAEFWAVRDTSFELRRGEVLGIIGPNGSGKSTILRVLNGIYPPDYGEIVRRGRMGALIALGAGFHGHMTGRENIWVNGTILGMTRRELNRKVDQIIEFADIEEFIDAPVATYSSGMTVRLGFAIAAFIEPQVLLIDEVLSVGDAKFKRRCIDRMTLLKEHEGVSIIFISHNMWSVQQLCDRVIRMDHGCFVDEGTPGDVIERYLNHAETTGEKTEGPDWIVDETGAARVEHVEAIDAAGTVVDQLMTHEPFSLRIHFTTLETIESPVFIAGLSREGDTHLLANMLIDGAKTGVIAPGRYSIDLRFETLPLLPGRYEMLAYMKHHAEANAARPRRYGFIDISLDYSRYHVCAKTASVACRGRFRHCAQYRWYYQGRLVGGVYRDV